MTETYLEALCAVRDGDKPTDPENVLRMLTEKHATGAPVRNCRSIFRGFTGRYTMWLEDSGRAVLRTNGLPDHKEYK